MRKGEILSRKWSDIDLNSGNPCIYVRQTKNDEPKRIQLPDIAVDALRALPSYGRHEFVFPAKPNPRFKGNFKRFKGNFKRPHAWDFGRRFRRVAKLAGVKDLRIHDLRHFAASTLTGAGIEDNIISLLTGHKSRELRRYQHLREELKRKTVDLIAGVLKEAEKKRKRPSSSRLLHGASKKAKSQPKKNL
jgi:integrase